MERILRSGKMAEIVLVPIRHHSPACAVHVRRMIEKLRPSVVLIEGPDNANSLIPVMVHKDTRAPFAIYYSYNDAQGHISEEKGQYKCYYPFLDYSPELEALRTAAELLIPAEFMDLSYGDILASSKAGKGLLQEEEKNNYNDDYYLSRNDFVAKLCEKTGLRNFNEFWEKYFELNGLHKESEEWFNGLSVYCRLVRENTPVNILQEEGCLARERHMAERILEQAEKVGAKGIVLAVTGGFHTPGLKALLEEEETAKERQTGIYLKNQGVYLMAYSMDAADALNGYASGMPFAGFYQQIWEKRKESGTPYKDTILEMLIAAGKETGKREGGLCAYDEICAYAMAEGLAALREKKEPGAYELLDTVLSNYVKGEYTLATDTPMRVLRKMMTGQQVGVLCGEADVPPIVHDFEEQCKKFGLKITSTLEKELTLSIFSSPKHRQESMLLNRMKFLKTGFAKKIKGPDLQKNLDQSRVREIWKYKWSAGVTAALIDVSVYGATIAEACTGLTRAELRKELDARSSALLLTQVFEMGLREQLRPVYDRVQELLLLDTDFYSLGDALKSLLMMSGLSGLYDVEQDFDGLVNLACQRLISLLPAIVQVKDENLEQCMKILKLLYQITGSDGVLSAKQEQFYAVLGEMKADSRIHAGLNGCIHGICYGGNRETAEETRIACQGYLMGTGEQMKQTASFFHGLFFSARDLIFVGKEFMEELDTFLKQAPEEDFMELLPELRIAFAYFTPWEIHRIAGQAAALHSVGREEITERKEVLPEWSSYGRVLDTYVRQRMGEEKND